jgi:methyl coenzyme M reductase gamma subunit
MMAGGPVAYTKSPNVPAAMAALLQLSEQDIRDILGNQEQGDKIVSNISGKVVEMVQQRLDMQTFLYMSNMAKAIRRSGEIWLGMAKEVYVEPKRKMKSLGAQNEIQTIELLRPTIDEETGQIIYENDLSNAHLDVAVDVGPSFSSQRAAIVRALTDMMAITTDQQTQQVLQAIALMNMEGEGMSDAREYFRRKLVDMGVLPPNEEDKKRIMEAMANQQPDPNTIFMQAAAEEATAKATRARAEVVKAMADTELTRAKTVETLANIDMSQRDQILRTADTLGTMLREQATEVAPPRSQRCFPPATFNG